MTLKIGIFDSGIGGLSIAKVIWKRFQDAEIYYLADRKFAPYGELAEDEITKRVKWCGDELFKKNVDLIIVACNTATAAGIELLRKNLGIPIIGLEPDLNFYQRLSLEVDPADICVMCTSYTLKSAKFKNLIERRDPDKKMVYKGMKNLARLIENCFWEQGARVENELLIVKHLNEEIQGQAYKYIVLGCTHYELISTLIENVTGAKTVGVSNAIASRCCDLFTSLKSSPARDADSCGGFFFCDSFNQEWEEIKLQDFLSWPRD